jgi:hypothetical protein
LAVLDVFRTLIQYFGKDMGDKLHSLVLDFTLPLLDAPKVDLRKRASVTLGTPLVCVSACALALFVGLSFVFLWGDDR